MVDSEFVRGATRARTVLAVLLTVVVASIAALSTVLVDDAAGVERPEGAGPPPPGSGMGTPAAMNNPACNVGEKYGPYGNFDSAYVGGGPVCVKPWKDGADNGGATARGVTADSIKVVAIVPNSAQPQAGAPTYRATGQASTWMNAFHDQLLVLQVYYETWGRAIEVVYFTSSGDDEAAQRADAVAITAEEPFAVIDLVASGLDVLDTALAQNEIMVYGSSTTVEKALALAPYRWGSTDSQAVAVNAADVLTKQVVGKKAKYAGSDELKSKDRSFGVVYIDNLFDFDSFKSDLAKGGGKLVSENSYPSNGTTTGNAPVQEYAPTMVARMKAAGVTTVILFSDTSMTGAMMAEANKQDWYPEWFLTGAVFQDISLLARSYPPEQSAHAFGISSLFPWVLPDAAVPPAVPLATKIDPMNYYWGQGVGSIAQVIPSMTRWLLDGIHTAGPKLSTKTFKQGLFAMPPTGGAASGYPTGLMTGYGRTVNLPYDQYLSFGVDFAPAWFDPETSGPSAGTGTVGKGITWYADGGKRYMPRTAPQKEFGWFNDAKSVNSFEERPGPTPVYVGDCETCPVTTGSPTPGSPSPSGFTAAAHSVQPTAAK